MKEDLFTSVDIFRHILNDSEIPDVLAGLMFSQRDIPKQHHGNSKSQEASLGKLWF
tara:strand:- start:551 stop:718 length:168 start_codon:yes stop_codon:yes gene_type:complete